MENHTLIELTAEIVSTHVSNNQVALRDVADLIRKVHAALVGLGKPLAAPAPEGLKAAVSVRTSVKPDYLVCLACGRKQKTLKRHLSVAHDLTPNEYRAEFDLPKSYPMTAASYSEQRRAFARKIGLGSKGRGGGKAPAIGPAPKRRGRPRQVAQ